MDLKKGQPLLFDVIKAEMTLHPNIKGTAINRNGTAFSI